MLLSHDLYRRHSFVIMKKENASRCENLRPKSKFCESISITKLSQKDNVNWKQNSYRNSLDIRNGEVSE